MIDVFVHASGQDDNLGDSALRAGLLDALRTDASRLHVYLGVQSADYVCGVRLNAADQRYATREEWIGALAKAERPVYVLNAGEINLRARARFPNPAQSHEMRRVIARGGVVIGAGLGFRDPVAAQQAVFDRVLSRAGIISWRDTGSRDAAGLGDVAPDWAFVLGTPVEEWSAAHERPLLAITMRFDRPWPDGAWFEAVRAFANDTSSRIVTVAQVARDAPRAVRLAEALEGDYLVPRSMRHDDLDAHVRSIYARSLAVISDRAHGLIIAATEGAYPIGSGSDPQKIARLLAAAGLGELVGRYDEFAGFATRFDTRIARLAPAVTAARADVAALTARIRTAMNAVA